MGAWGSGIYENDTALDIRDMLEEALDEDGLNSKVISEVVAYIEGLDDEDEAPLAWIALADMLAEVGKLTVPLKERALSYIKNAFVKEALSPDAIEAFRNKLSSKASLVKRRVRCKSLILETGSIYLYDVLPEWKSNPFLSGWNIGFWIVDQMPDQHGDIPIAYFFRTKKSFEELKGNPCLVSKVQIWPAAPSPEPQRYHYKWMFLTTKVYKEVYSRLRYCGNCTTFPILQDEYHDPTPGYLGYMLMTIDETAEESLLRFESILSEYDRIHSVVE